MRAHELRKLFEFAGRFNHSQTRHRRRDFSQRSRHRPRRISDRQRTLDHEASCWKPRITRHLGRTEEYLFYNIPRLRRRQSLAKIGKRSVDVSIENLAKELFFVAKSSVKTGPIDAHGPRQV